ncbi:MAG TPA: hypothetical protein DIS90_03235 [Cytophagales bacterium]|nr:hypothetical protein [Cytophagales bacterium]HCR53578.1 hypothetical protein [Cytophagales bacterium]
MKKLLPFVLLIILGCQGSLTEEQKKEMREGMKANEIVKISDAEITAAAFQYGRSISDKITNQVSLDPQLTAELQQQYHVKIFPLAPGDSLLMEIEQQLIEAYTTASDINLTDNVQKIGTDSLLYTLPVMNTLPDGSVVFKYALGIRMPTKAVVQSMEKK